MILKEFPRIDILHGIIFEILKNLQDQINGKKELLSLVANFIIDVRKDLKIPCETKKSVNAISLHYIHELVQQLDIEKIPSAL